MITPDTASVRNTPRAIAGLDPHLPLVGRDEQDDAVVALLVADLPGAAQPVAIILDRPPFEAVDRRDHELPPGLRLQRLGLDCEVELLLRPEQVRLVDHAAGQLRERSAPTQARPARSSASHRTTKKARHLSSRVEVDLRRCLRAGGGLERHLRLGAVEDLGADRVGEGADARVIGLHRLVIVAARRVIGSRCPRAGPAARGSSALDLRSG